MRAAGVVAPERFGGWRRCCTYRGRRV